MRADRLVAALLLLQGRGRLTASELAGELEISVATARRDLEALSAAGIPVYPQPGRGGGWSLVGGARTDLTGLTAAEARALFLLLGPATTAAPALTSALRKLVRALPATFRADAEAAARAVVSDPAGWGEAGREPPALVRTLQDAVVAGHKVRLTYARKGSEPAERLVDPLGLVDKDGLWYLVAGTGAGRRTYRVDRVTAAEPTDLPAERPDGFDLAAEWERVVGEVERRRSLVTAVVLVAERHAGILRDHFGRHCEVLGREPDGRARLRVAAPMALSIAEQLAGWGAQVEVVEPEAVRAELARIGAELVARYAP
ncbi:helix-turn-helix transcriptional regulator [Nonomuraea wenchangensis]|uniref:Predicted DNA-binding transcriptional regulator YafY, contains an HTH and WYL domains n=1 Tax=Nonomuraea wenchangensis TaxID=568860 RepID=A0A1I0KJG0_9ACTN|nr:transcriptional regulator [Nonomuraea wenchangensis]SEU24924.1 Predicted DNA-binding transcriptional regulator YafY, contains an HTH and WYL domains [Nonomuraea wenchangensis]